MNQYADILLPLPLMQTFTYRLSEEQSDAARIGLRVIVPFGKQHYYTGIILTLHNHRPEDCEVKEVQSIIDTTPIILHPQLSLWQWIAQYYLCSVGDVMKAALPSGLKLESETTVSVNAEYEEDADDRLTPQEQELIGIMGSKPMSIDALERLSGRQNLLPAVRRLILKEAVFVSEEIVRHYKPKTQHCVRIKVSRQDSITLNFIFDQLRRSAKQQSLFLKLLDMSHFLQKETPDAVTQQDLLQQAGCSTAILNELRRKGWIEIYAAPVSRLQTAAPESLQSPSPLSEVQSRALEEIVRSYRTHNICLLHGVTSSGKTEIYIHLIGQVLSQKRQVLFMVPEIALTTQLCLRLAKVFGKRMIVYHSKLSDAERVEIWHRLLTDTSIDLILGVRSSVLLPFRQLGLIIVDEEHEPSYKQQDPAPRYNARDVSIVLAQRHGAKVLLGSATPCIESYYLAVQGRYGLVTLTERHAGLHLPQITLVSLTEARRQKNLTGPFTPALLQGISRTLSEGAQVILFQNRRGFAPMVECPACSWTPRCPRCDVSLTYHKRTRSLDCHYCGYTQPLPTTCPACGNRIMEQIGYGTERVEESIAALLPMAKTSRMDTDTTQGKRSYEKIIGQFEAHKTNVLVGTQMVSKGLDFGGVKMVGILNADTLMNYPDFRAFERAFQMMEQVAGRAGRKAGEGCVIIQCSDPRHPLLQQVVHHDYLGMMQSQLDDRKRYHYPPFTRMIALYLKGRNEETLQPLALEYAARLRQSFGDRVLGPEAPVVARIKNFYIRKILLKVEREASTTEVRRILLQIQDEVRRRRDFARLIFYYDVDPM